MIKKTSQQILILALSLLALGGCHAKDDHQAEPLVYRINELPIDFQTPKEFWQQLKTEVSEPLSLREVEIHLKEKNPGVLKKPEIIIEFPPGGGSLDLAKILGEASGSFFFSIRGFQEAPLETQKAYFFSDNRRKKVDGEVLGLGCNRWVEWSKTYRNQNLKEGLLVNTTQSRHLHVLGGHFVLISTDPKNLFITQVTLFDSRYPAAHCNSKVAVEEPEP